MIGVLGTMDKIEYNSVPYEIFRIISCSIYFKNEYITWFIGQEKIFPLDGVDHVNKSYWGIF